MSLKDSLLPLFKENRNKFLSGEDVAHQLNVSRAAVWKAINVLRNDGYRIEAVTNKGYRLADDNDILSASGVENYLEKSDCNIKIYMYDTITSTNAALKEMAANGTKEGATVIAAEQTAGRGRFKRQFYSPKTSGIYMSMLIKPHIPASQSTAITTAAAVAVSEAAEAVSGKKTAIKWVNDVLINRKKICGILTEASVDIESGSLQYAIVGIGVNVYKPDGGFPDDIKNIAGAVFDEPGYDLRNRLAAEIINRFMRYYKELDKKTYLAAYRERCIVPGRKITVLSHDKSTKALALDVDDDCRLHVRYDDGSEDYLSSGEISIRL